MKDRESTNEFDNSPEPATDQLLVKTAGAAAAPPVDDQAPPDVIIEN